MLGRPIRIGDNFFEVGGHSILATRLTFQLREAIKQDFPLNMLYQYPSVKALSTAVTVSWAGRDHEWPPFCLALSKSYAMLIPLQQSSIDPSLELMGSSRESAEKIDPAQEVMLDASIAANGRTFDWAKAPEGIFLTGATVRGGEALGVGGGGRGGGVRLSEDWHKSTNLGFPWANPA